jgi:hypothetical protein
MATADTARLIASLELQDKFSANADKFERALGGMERKTSTLGKIGGEVSRGAQTAVRNIATIGVFAAGAIASQVALGVQSLAQLEEVKNQTDAVIKSTQGAANVTAEEVRAQAEALEDLSTVDDKVIQRGQNMLLTFKGIRNEVGEGNDIFNQATETALDMSVALGTDIKDSAIQLGKALNDPIRGISALRRVGVQFTEEQEDQIRTMVEAGDVMGAQKLILRELNDEFGGSAEAFGKGPGASLRRFGDAVEGAQQALATGFLPLMEKVSEKIQTLLADPAVLKQIQDFGVGAADTLDSLIDTALALPWGAIGDAFRLMGTGAKAALDFFTGMPSWIQTAVLTGWGLNKLTGGALGSIVGTLGSGLIKGVLGMNAGVVNINAATVNGGVGGAAGGAAAAGRGGGVLGTLSKVVAVGIAAQLASEFGPHIARIGQDLHEEWGLPDPPPWLTGFLGLGVNDIPFLNDLLNKQPTKTLEPGPLGKSSAGTGTPGGSGTSEWAAGLNDVEVAVKTATTEWAAGLSDIEAEIAMLPDTSMLSPAVSALTQNLPSINSKAAQGLAATQGLGSRIDRVANTPHNVDVDTHVTVHTSVGVSVLQQQAYRSRTVYNRDSVSTNTAGF